MSTEQNFIAHIHSQNVSSSTYGKLFHEVHEKTKQMVMNHLKNNWYMVFDKYIDRTTYQEDVHDIAFDALDMAVHKIREGKFAWKGPNSLYKYLNVICKNMSRKFIQTLNKIHSIKQGQAYLYDLDARENRSDTVNEVFNVTNFEHCTFSQAIMELEEHIPSKKLKQVYRLGCLGVSDDQICEIMQYKDAGSVRRRRYESYRHIRENVDRDLIYLQTRISA